MFLFGQTKLLTDEIVALRAELKRKDEFILLLLERMVPGRKPKIGTGEGSQPYGYAPLQTNLCDQPGVAISGTGTSDRMGDPLTRAELAAEKESIPKERVDSGFQGGVRWTGLIDEG